VFWLSLTGCSSCSILTAAIPVSSAIWNEMNHVFVNACGELDVLLPRRWKPWDVVVLQSARRLFRFLSFTSFYELTSFSLEIVSIYFRSIFVILYTLLAALPGFWYIVHDPSNASLIQLYYSFTYKVTLWICSKMRSSENDVFTTFSLRVSRVFSSLGSLIRSLLLIVHSDHR
jgi:hypothetical protein